MAAACGDADGKICDPLLERRMSVWQRLVALFRFDFRSAFGSTPRLPAPETGTAEQDEQMPLPFELDVQKLNYVQYRRRILDWRDEFAVQMLADGQEIFRQFSEYVEKEADEVGILRKLFAKPAAEVLEDKFFTLVRSPLADRVRTAEAQLGKVIQSRALAQSPSLSLSVEEVDPSLSILGDRGFRPSNQEEILSKLNHLVFGEHGVIDCYLQRAQAISLSLLQATDAKS